MTDHTENRLAQLEKMKALVVSSRRVKEVFDEAWFEQVRKGILAARGDPALKMPRHAAFIGFFLDEGQTPNLIEEVDDAFEVVSTATRKRLSARLRGVTGELEDYVSTVFEMRVLQRFARCGLLDEHEPMISTGRPEARINLAGKSALVEARATLDDAFPPQDGAVNPDEYAGKLASKLAEKYGGQLAGAAEPVILFVGLNQGLHLGSEEVKRALKRIAEDPASRVLSAIVLFDDYRCRRFVIWKHPDAKHPLPDAYGELEKILG